MTLATGYRTSVNEPETITDAQAINGRFCHHTGTGFRNRFGDRFAPVVAIARNIERS
jgi:hypothetical protein